ncbi:MAG: hypothetical protein NC094_09395 [Bacteroidales bacterium]|nr:hypothetical protein [Lachnoclostridium sp.]MCM1384911.1 hypothetical protein [Lachnoclostridium sp.]MCM1465621.1 hypothetical protein [Bacteroidales bacterium]
MSVLQEQIVQKISGLSEDNLQFLLEMINRFMQPETEEKKNIAITERIGIAKGQNLYDDNYDFDEMNPEIAKMFGVME